MLNRMDYEIMVEVEIEVKRIYLLCEHFKKFNRDFDEKKFIETLKARL